MVQNIIVEKILGGMYGGKRTFRYRLLCPVCGMEFVRGQWDVCGGKYTWLFCSRECADRFHSSRMSGKGNPLYGKHHTEESRRKISENRIYLKGKEHPSYGRRLTEEQKKACSERELREKRWRWKGGVHKYFWQYPPEWNDALKTKVKKRDNYKCVMCGKTQDEVVKLDIHHINEAKDDCSMTNLMTLCNDCHLRAHGRSKRVVATAIRGLFEVKKFKSKVA